MIMQETELMEGAFRLLVENCDNFQVGSVLSDYWSSISRRRF